MTTTPTALNRSSWFYAVGNTPATNLTRAVPHGVDASVLSLGCGDLRNVLFTCYMQQQGQDRKIDFTLCDYDESIFARNLLLLTLIIEGEEIITNDELWEAYYALRVSDSLTQKIHNHASQLAALLETCQRWANSKYGKYIQFCDEDTRHDVAAKIAVIRDAAIGDKDKASACLRKNLLTARRFGSMRTGGPQRPNESINFTGVRSAGPCSLQAAQDVVETFREYWREVEFPENTTLKDAQSSMTPNAMIASLLTDQHPLHYGSDPTNGFHLALAFAPLMEGSPMAFKDKSSKSKLVDTAKSQFVAWVNAYRESYKKLFRVKMVVADVFAFTHTLQHVVSMGDTCAGWYRRQLDPKPLRLTERLYGKDLDSSPRFDAVDTSNIADHFGALNVLVATAPLLIDEPWATVGIELLIRRSNSHKEAADKLLCGHWPTMSLLLGLYPIQLWSNAQLESPMEDIFLRVMTKEKKGDAISGQMHSRMAWKRNDQVRGGASKGIKTEFDAKELAGFLSKVYGEMCLNDGGETGPKQVLVYPHYHNGSFVALLRAVQYAVSTEWEVFYPFFLDQAFGTQREGAPGGMLRADLVSQLQIQGLWVEPSLSIQKMPDGEPFRDWKQPTSAVAVTAVIPKSYITGLFSGHEMQDFAPPILYGAIKAGREQHKFSGIRLAWGSLTRSQPESSKNPNFSVAEDDSGFNGESPLLASFMVPTSLLLLEPHLVKVKLCILDVANGTELYAPTIGPSLELLEANLLDDVKVCISEYLPGQTSHCSLAKAFEGEGDFVRLETANGFVKLAAAIGDAPNQKITTVTSRFDVTSNKVKQLLKDKCSVALRSTETPYAIDLSLGSGKDEFVLRELFPLPVDDEGAKTRIARTSGWIEVIAQVAEPLETKRLRSCIFPASLNASKIPASLNMQYLNLDKLPIINLNASENQLSWLNVLGSIQWSPREKKTRSQGLQTLAAPEDALRVNFKESIFTIMMVASGIQGDQTGLFAFSNPERGGAHMLLLVSAFRLDGDTRSVVVDGALIPLTTELVSTKKMREFLLGLQDLKLASINVDDDELALWKMVMPSMVERCRTWSHLPSCEYKSPGATIPLSTGFGEKLLCSCGNGKLPPKFLSIPSWETAAAPHAVRVALSPVFAVQSVEDLFDSGEAV